MFQSAVSAIAGVPESGSAFPTSESFDLPSFENRPRSPIELLLPWHNPTPLVTIQGGVAR
jgi:hypothetical protein